MTGSAPCFNLPIGAEPTVYLGIGTNLGNRLDNLRQAVTRLRVILTVDAVSRVFESAPVGYAEQPDYLNLVLRGRTDFEPLALLEQIKQLEVELGREVTFRNGPRLIDIDILRYGDLVLHTADLTLPHPRMLERSFVVLPLADVDPAFALQSRALAATLPPARPLGDL